MARKKRRDAREIVSEGDEATRKEDPKLATREKCSAREQSIDELRRVAGNGIALME